MPLKLPLRVHVNKTHAGIVIAAHLLDSEGTVLGTVDDNRRCNALEELVALANSAAENAAECERLRGLVRELRAERRPKEYVGNPRWAEERADYDATTEAMLAPLSSLETARQAGGGE